MICWFRASLYFVIVNVIENYSYAYVIYMHIYISYHDVRFHNAYRFR